MLRVTAILFTCLAGLAAAPSITGIYNAASYNPPGLPNSGIAQGSIFTVFGTGLGPATLQQAQSYPLFTTQGLAGTSMQVTVGSVTENCIMIYTSSGQVAAILPSATPVGSGTLSLSYQGGTGSIPITVLAANFGTFTLNEAGDGPAVVTDSSYNPITMINPAHPGQTLILWGTGLGAVSGNETEPPTEADLGTGVQVFVANQPATVVYGGRSSSPGLDQINFVVPAGAGGCKTSIAVLVKGVTGNVTTTSIGPAGQTTCGDTYGALTAANLQNAISKGSMSIGFVALSHLSGGNDDVIGGFGTFPLNSLIRSFGGAPGPSSGSCLAYEVEGTSLTFSDPIKATALNTGADLMITGPSGDQAIPASSTGDYPGILATAPSVFISPGGFSVSNGAGGSDVGSFTWDLTLPPAITPTNIPSSVNPSQDLTLTWSGGSAYPLVTIFAYNGVKATSTLKSYVDIICTADASAGTFAIPAAMLNLLPRDGYGTPTEPGVSVQLAGYAVQRFTVTAGSTGLDSGTFSAFVASGAVAAIQ